MRRSGSVRPGLWHGSHAAAAVQQLSVGFKRPEFSDSCCYMCRSFCCRKSVDLQGDKGPACLRYGRQCGAVRFAVHHYPIADRDCSRPCRRHKSEAMDCACCFGHNDYCGGTQRRSKGILTLLRTVLINRYNECRKNWEKLDGGKYCRYCLSFSLNDYDFGATAQFRHTGRFCFFL